MKVSHKSVLFGALTYLVLLGILKVMDQFPDVFFWKFTALYRYLMLPACGYVAARVEKNNGLIVGAYTGILIATVSIVIRTDFFAENDYGQSFFVKNLVLVIKFGIFAALGGYARDLHMKTKKLLTIQKESIRDLLTEISMKNSLGELTNDYYAIHMDSMLALILSPSSRAKVKRFFIGMTNSHFIMQQVSEWAKPKGDPIIAIWNDIKILCIKKVYNGKQVFVKVNQNYYALKMVRNISDWENSELQFDEIIELFHGKMRASVSAT